MTSLVHEYENGQRDVNVRRFVNWIHGGKKKRKHVQVEDTVSIGIVGGGPAGLVSALVLAKLDWNVHITIYEKRNTRSRPQTVFLDFTNLLAQDFGATGNVFSDMWTRLKRKNTCLVSIPFFADKRCFGVKDLKKLNVYDEDGRHDFPRTLGGMSIPIYLIEQTLEEEIANFPNINILKRDVTDIAPIVAKHQIILGCEGRNSLVAKSIHAQKIPMPGIPNPKELYALLVRFKGPKPTISQIKATTNDAQHRFRFFHQPDGTTTLIIQFRSKVALSVSDVPLHDTHGMIQRIIAEGSTMMQLDIPKSARVTVFNIDPYYRTIPCSIIETKTGSSFACLVGDSLVGVSFLSGWGLNSALRQINDLDRTLKEGMQLKSIVRGSITEELWLQFLSTTYTFVTKDTVRESILRTLSVIPMKEFEGTIHDISNTALTAQSVIKVDRISFNPDPPIITIGNPLVQTHKHELMKAIRAIKDPPLEDIFVWPHDPSNVKLIQRLQKKFKILNIASGQISKWTRTSKLVTPISDESRFALYTQELLKTNVVLRFPLGHVPNDYSYNSLIEKYKHIKDPNPLKPKYIYNTQTRSMVSILLPVDLMWNLVRNMDVTFPDIFCYILCKSDFDKESIDIPIVRSWWSQNNIPRQVGPDRQFDDVTTRSREVLSSIHNTDVRVGILVDRKFGRPCAYLLKALEKAYEPKLKNMYFGVSSVLK